MRNFRSPLIATATLKVIDPNEKLKGEDKIMNRYDFQLLPEGGQAVARVLIKVGAALKITMGIRTNATGKVLKDGV